MTREFSPGRSSTALERVSLPLGVSFVQKGDFLFSTGGESKAETSLDEFLLDEFSFSLYRCRDDRDFFFLGNDNELVTGKVTGESARKVFDCLFLCIS